MYLWGTLSYSSYKVMHKVIFNVDAAKTSQVLMKKETEKSRNSLISSLASTKRKYFLSKVILFSDFHLQMTFQRIAPIWMVIILHWKFTKGRFIFICWIYKIMIASQLQVLSYISRILIEMSVYKLEYLFSNLEVKFKNKNQKTPYPFRM